MSITVKFIVNGHSCEVTVEQPEMLSKAIDATIKAMQTVPYNVDLPIKGLPSPSAYPPGFQLYKDATLTNIDKSLVWP